MDEELKQFLIGMESRHTASLGELRQEMASMETRLREHTETVETRLLSEFWKWARVADARYRQHHGNVVGLDERVQLVEDRVAELERRA